MANFDADVAVIGLGSMGSFAFWQLARMEVNVIGFERFKPGHDNGAGHGETRIFRTAYGEGVEYVPFLQDARRLWKELEEETGVELYTEVGGLMVGEVGSEFISNVKESVKQYDLLHQNFNGTEAKEYLPQLTFKENDTAVLERFAGFVKPELAIETAVERGIELGGTIYTESPVTAIEPDSEGVTISCGDKNFRVGKIIIAAGGWTSKLMPQLELPVWIERQVLVWYEAENPEIFAPDKFPIFYRDLGDDIGFYGFPSVDGKTVKVAFHHGGVEVDHPDNVDREIHEETDLTPVTNKVLEYIPSLKPTPVKSKTCFYTNTEDGDFIVGRAPGLKNVVLLGPMAGHGFKFAPVMGKIGAYLATDKELDLDISIFDPNRFKNKVTTINN